MTFSFASMIRLLALGAVGLTMLAVGVARLAPPEPTCRFESPVTRFSINDHLLGVSDRHPRWLDAERGTVALTPLEGDDVLETASCSPWVDSRGQRQVVGRWSNRTYEGPKTIANEFGIARFSFPDGQLLDRVPLENFPTSPPCWLPGDRARVLFVAGDGLLRRIDFESGEDREASHRKTPEAVLVTWDCPRPGAGTVYFGEVAWPRIPREQFGDCLVASLRIKHPDPKQGMALSHSEAWWLRLDPEGTRIVAAGPLLERSTAAGGDDRNPAVARLSDGSLGLAFAHQEGHNLAWSICLGRLEILPDGRPQCRESSVRILDVSPQLGPLAFSTDGRYLNALVVEPHEAPVVSRYRTTHDVVAPLQLAGLVH